MLAMLRYILNVFELTEPVHKDSFASKMLKVLTLSVLLSGGLVKVDGQGEIGPGIWNLKHLNKCEMANHRFKFDIEKKKYNRSHDAIDAHVIFEEDFTDEFGVRVDICKEVDGGCKPYQVLTDNSFMNFVYKYAEENVRTFFGMAHLDPPEFPVPAGSYDVENFMFNNDELPDEGPYGEYCARGYMLRGNEELGCLEAYVDFIKEEDCDE